MRTPTEKPKRQRAPGAGRKPKGYGIFPTVRMPLESIERIRDAQRVGESLGETIARAFGWEPRR